MSRGTNRKTLARRLTDREKLLVEYYCGEANFSRPVAMRLAGYKSTAQNYSARLFARPSIAAAIELRKKALKQNLKITPERVLAEFAKIAFADLSEFMVPQPDGTLAWDFSHASPEQLSAIQELGVDFYVEGKGESAKQIKKFRIKPHSKLDALNALARNLGLFNDKLEVSAGQSVMDRLRAGRERVRRDAIEGKAEDVSVHDLSQTVDKEEVRDGDETQAG